VNSLGDKKRGVNAEDFRSFLLDLAPKVRNGVIILDNAKIHHADILTSTWAMLQATYGISHLFLSPYSPFLNPIEYAFNMLKNDVRESHFRNRGELIESIKECIPHITPTQAHGFFKKAVEYHPQVLLGVPFRGKPLDPELPTHRTTPVTAQALAIQ
jgi:transposase